MKRLLLTIVIAAGVMPIALGVMLFGAGGQTALGDDPDGVITGLDMDPAGNTATSLATIDRCREASAGDVIDIDVFIDDIEAGPPNNDESILHSAYDLGGWPASGTDGTPPQITARNHLLFLNAAVGSFIQDLSEAVPDGDDPHVVIIADFVAAEYNPPYTQGAMGRYTLDTTNANAGLYRLTLSNVVHGRDVPPGGQVPNKAIRDSDYCDAGGCYGLLAVDVPCRTTVGGVAEYLDVDEPALLSTADSSGGSSAPLHGVVAGAAAAAAVAIVAGGWYARGRWLR